MNTIISNNKLYQNRKEFLPDFKGKGIELVEDWSHNPMRAKYHKEIAHDLAEGSKLYFEKHKEIDNTVLNLYNNGGLTVIFYIPNNEILKVSLENPLEFRKHNPEFDIPFLTPVEKYGKTYVVKQPKADTKNITREHILEVIKQIYLNWCELSSDGNLFEQYGLYNGKPYLIDTRCAKPMPDMWTVIIDRLFSKLNKCYTIVSIKQNKIEKEQAFKKKGYFAYHCDETPRKSLTFKGGLLKIFYAVRNRIKYKKNNYCIPYEDFRIQQLNIQKYVKCKKSIL